MTGIRVKTLRLSGTEQSQRTYEVSFRDAGRPSSHRPLSVIAGPSQTGKSSVAEFIAYCLGGRTFPLHDEIAAAVRTVAIEVDLDDETTVIERAAVDADSSFASIWRASFAELRDAVDIEEERLSTDTSAPVSLSQLVLESCGLNNVDLPVAPNNEDSDTQIFSIRDLLKLFWVPNERVDSSNLVHENSPYMVSQKFQQTVDLVFDVFDGDASRRAAQIRNAREAAQEARRSAESLRDVVEAEYPDGPMEIAARMSDAQGVIDGLVERVHEIDTESRARNRSSQALRDDLERANRQATSARQRVDNRLSLLTRLGALRSQYADDKRKLAFLQEAERMFNPLRVEVCPACLSWLEKSPAVIDGSCTLCGANSTHHGEASGLSDETADDLDVVIRAELRSVGSRLSDLTDYYRRLELDLGALEAERSDADARAVRLAEALGNALDLPAPYLAERDSLSYQLEEARVARRSLEAGARLWDRVSSAQATADRLQGELVRLREEARESRSQLGRQEVVTMLSARFGEVLEEFDYPKLQGNAYLNDQLVPFVRGHHYTMASSGGRTLITLAWYLALWEVAYESGAAMPGLLIIDSPQKNLGHSVAGPNEDPDFADTRLVENFYRHIATWLDGAGAGAQAIIIDNSPPEWIEPVIRFTRDASQYPYGLIADAVI